jgi:Ca-activated chloride channel family protein
MKRLFLIVATFIACQLVFATGIIVNKNSTTFQTIKLNSCHYEVDIQDQISAVTCTEVFYNTTNSAVEPRYYFPVPRGASATQLRWFINGVWHTAAIAATPQSPQGGPTSFPNNFVIYISLMPLVFDMAQTLQPGNSMTVEVTYAQLLPYAFGNINLILRNDYTAMQSLPLQSQQVDITLTSERNIDSFALNLPNATIANNGHLATAHLQISNASAVSDYSLIYSLSQTELGFQAISTLRDSIPDTFGHGFFSFIIEPNAEVINNDLPNKITLLIDHSGSMNYDNKIEQAKSACSYIVDNLGDNDMFDLITFDHVVVPLWSSLRQNNPSNVQDAHTFINQINAIEQNGTNLSGTLQYAVNLYNLAPDTYNNIIILITDGQPTAGITDSYLLVNTIDTAIAQTEANIRLFNFGIGTDVNYQLLTLLSENNNGTAIFLGNNEIYETITSFYDMIRQSAMQNVSINVLPAGAITEIYPSPTPNLFNSSQLIISGRYTTPRNIQITLSGTTGGEPVSMQYEAVLSETTDSLLQFIPKIWASKKIDQLLVQYYSYNATSPEAIALKEQIVDLSLSYGVVCVFTSFTGGETPDEDIIEEVTPKDIVLLGNYPNPFNPETRIRFEVLKDMKAPAFIEIYNLKGQVVRSLAIRINKKGIYEVYWDGKDNNGMRAASGNYFYKIRINNYILTGKMVMLK